MKNLGWSILLLLCCSCERLFMAEDPKNSLVENFDVFWQEFDRHYSFFEMKGIDWDSVYAEHRPKVDDFTNSTQLFSLLEEIILSLEDGHVNLYSSSKWVGYDFREGYPENEPDVSGYLENIESPNPTIYHGEIRNTELGYVRIVSFGRDGSHYYVINDITKRFSEKKGMIIDVRSNGGGSDLNSRVIAARFTDQKRLYKKFRYRNGPEHDDFTEWFDSYIEPYGNTFLKPVAILTNRGCYSTTEDFIQSMVVNPQVTTVGGITGGGSGNPLYRELMNGWYFRLSSWIVVTPAFESYEGVGIRPDIEVTITEEDVNNRRDAILERAVELLE